MKPKRGRQSAADRTVIPFSPSAYRLQPPANLDREAADIFRQIVNSCPESHFVSSDGYLLAAYCSALVISRKAARDLGKPGALMMWEKASRLLAQLATKLRLCPSARSDPKTVARASGDFQPSYYDLQRGNE